MEASINFEIAVYFAWVTGIALLLLFVRLLPQHWHQLESPALANPIKETLFAFIAIICLIAISISTDSFLKPLKRNSDFGSLIHFVQILVVYCPIFASLKWRKQSLKTCFLSFEKLPFKILAGITFSLVASFIFLSMRGLASSYPEFLITLGKRGVVAMFQTFMEGFGIGFLLYRFGAWIGVTWSTVLVAAIFMAAHIPNYTSGTFGFSLPIAILMAVAHAGIAILIIVVVWKTQDIIVFGFIHWFINRAADFSSV